MGATVTHMARNVGVRELRQHLSRYLAEVKDGESFTVTERGREVARLTPWGPPDSPLGRLVAERGATMPTADLAALDAPNGRPADGPPSETVLDELREERL
jgi:prevent-host-death family protein